MTADLVSNWPLVVSVAAVVIVAMLLVSRFLHRDPQVRRSRYGFFVERDRFDHGWPELAPPEDRASPTWADRTAEIPPSEGKE